MSNGVIESETLNQFAANPSLFLERLRLNGEPLLLTSEGGAEVVVQDAESYQRLMETIDRLETLAAVKEGQRDVGADRTRPMRLAMAELARKYHLPPVSPE